MSCSQRRVYVQRQLRLRSRSAYVYSLDSPTVCDRLNSGLFGHNDVSGQYLNSQADSQVSWLLVITPACLRTVCQPYYLQIYDNHSSCLYR